MDMEYLGQLEQTLDEFRTKIKALEDAVTKIPQINMQVDPSRPAAVVVEPAALDGL
jgi:hypothetical protein